MRLIDADNLIEYICCSDVSTREKIVEAIERQPTQILSETPIAAAQKMLEITPNKSKLLEFAWHLVLALEE